MNHEAAELELRAEHNASEQERRYSHSTCRGGTQFASRGLDRGNAWSKLRIIGFGWTVLCRPAARTGTDRVSRTAAGSIVAPNTSERFGSPGRQLLQPPHCQGLL